MSISQSQKYRINILSEEDFNNLPYPETETSLGIADPQTNQAYVRYTGLKEVDSYLINHEVEHLIEHKGGIHSHHYRNGVYYKGGGGGGGGGGKIPFVKPGTVFPQQPQQDFSQPQQAQPPLTVFPSQASQIARPGGIGISGSIPSAVSASSGVGEPSGATGGTGALGGGQTGTPVGQIREELSPETAEKTRGFFSGRGGL